MGAIVISDIICVCNPDDSMESSSSSPAVLKWEMVSNIFDDVWWYSLFRVAITSKSHNLPTDRKSDGNGTRLFPLFLFFLPFVDRRDALFPTRFFILHFAPHRLERWQQRAKSFSLFLSTLFLRLALLAGGGGLPKLSVGSDSTAESEKKTKRHLLPFW